MKSYFEVYAELAKRELDTAVINGRYSTQQFAEQFILGDVIEKLSLDAQDIVLDIGCGGGVITLPLSCICKHVYGIDNDSAVSRLCENYIPSNITLISGNWFEMDIVSKIQGKEINKVVIYSVLHCLQNMDDVYSFIDKALSVLPENGKVLLGDIPNRDKKERFLSSEYGKQFDKRFREERLSRIDSQKDLAMNEIKKDLDVGATVVFDDKSVQELVEYYHKKRCDVYVLPQKTFCHLDIQGKIF